MKMVKHAIFFLGILALSCKSDSKTYIPLKAEEDEALSGGAVTSFNFSAEAFGFAAPDLNFEDRITFGLGNSLFNQSWVTAPSSTKARDGLGPFFNARNCSGCHFKDGRGRPPKLPNELTSGLLFRLSQSGTDLNGHNLPDPVYGNQLQDIAILGMEAEGNMNIQYEEIEVVYPDGVSVYLRKPTYALSNLVYGAPGDSTNISPRVANHLSGLGLLEAIPEEDLLALSDPNDSDGDGISGKANYVYDISTNSSKLGRFGWKANQPTVKQQIASAFVGDMGITSSLFPEERCPTPVDCDQIANGGSPEISDKNLDAVVFYSSTLAVPARREVDDPKILEGKALFEEINCTSCHVAKWQTGSHAISVLEDQTIRPYTDLLLHDMGPELADNAPDFLANGQEWRTAPLWGIGLIELVNDHTNLLHDGRARSIEEAILWHGGEAQITKQAFMALSAENREKLIMFINSL